MSAVSFTGARVQPRGLVALPVDDSDDPDNVRDVDRVRAVLRDISGCECDASGVPKVLRIGSESVYRREDRLGAGEFGAVYSFQRMPTYTGSVPRRVCVKVFFRDDEFEQERRVVDILYDAAHAPGTDRMLARAAELAVGDTGVRKNVILMEFGCGTLTDFAGKLSAQQAAAVVAAILREVQGIHAVSGLIATDITLANFLFHEDDDHALVVMACDYGGYAAEGTSVEHATYRHPLVDENEPIEVNVANAVFCAGATFFALLRQKPADLVGQGRATWSPYDHSRLRRIMSEHSVDARPEVANVANAMVRFDVHTNRFQRTQGRAAVPGDFDDIIRLLDELSHHTASP